jgi:hypothetical protein
MSITIVRRCENIPGKARALPTGTAGIVRPLSWTEATLGGSPPTRMTGYGSLGPASTRSTSSLRDPSANASCHAATEGNVSGSTPMRSNSVPPGSIVPASGIRDTLVAGSGKLGGITVSLVTYAARSLPTDNPALASTVSARDRATVCPWTKVPIARPVAANSTSTSPLESASRWTAIYEEGGIPSLRAHRRRAAERKTRAPRIENPPIAASGRRNSDPAGGR